MGISGLATFVKEVGLGEAASRSYANSKALKTKLVIDGWALLHHLYMTSRIDFISGGQYTQFEQELTQYFSSLSKAGFSPFVIFDGALADLKLPTSISRTENSCKNVRKILTTLDYTPTKRYSPDTILPALSGYVATHVLRKLQIPYSICDGEADVVLGSHAVNNECAVLSKDSDFFVFSSSVGYIPLDSIRFAQDKLSFRVHKRDDLCKNLGFAPALLPAFATLCGNDFVSRNLLRPFRTGLRDIIPATELTNYNERYHDIVRVGKFLARFKTQDEAFNEALDLYNVYLEKQQQERAAALAERARLEAEEKEKKEAEQRALEKAAAEALEGEKPADDAKPADDVKKTADDVVPAASKGEEKSQAASTNALTESSDDVEQEAGEKEGAGDDKQNKDEEEETIAAMDPVARKEKLLAMFNESAQQYVAQKVLIGNETTLKVHPSIVDRFNNNADLPAPLVQLYRQQLFSTGLMSVLCFMRYLHQLYVDDINQASSVLLSLPLRKLAYGILLGGPAKSEDAVAVTEYVREGVKVVEQKVEPTYILNGKKLPGIANVFSFAPRVKISLFLDILGANTPAIFALPPDWVFAAAILRNFITAKSDAGKPLTDGEVLALLAGMITKSHYATQGTRNDTPLVRGRNLLHFISEWQNHITTGILLNNVTLNPLPPPVVSRLFDGDTIVHYLSKTENKDVNYKKQLIKGQADLELFDKIYAAVHEGLSKVKKEDSAAAKKEFKTLDQQKKESSDADSARIVKNQFGALKKGGQDEEEEDVDDEVEEEEVEKKKKKKNKKKKPTAAVVETTTVSATTTPTTTSTTATTTTVTVATTAAAGGGGDDAVTTTSTTVVETTSVTVKMTKKEREAAAKKEDLAQFDALLSKLAVKGDKQNSNNTNNANNANNTAAANGNKGGNKNKKGKK